MKWERIFIITIAALLLNPLTASAGQPVLKSICEAGGEYGNIIRITLSRDYVYGKLLIQRTAPNSIYTRDLADFKGGTYWVDISSRGGIKGYILEYASKTEEATLQKAEGVLKCLSSLPSGQETVLDPRTIPPDRHEPLYIQH